MNRFSVYRQGFWLFCFSLSIFSQMHMGTMLQEVLFDLNGGVVHSIISTSDSGFLITGSRPTDSSDADIFLFKSSSNGTQEWVQFLGGKNDESGNCVVQTLDGGYIIAGSTSSYGAGEEDALLSKFNANGSLEWFRTYGSPYEDIAYSVLQTLDTGYIFCGTNSDVNGNKSMFVIKTDATGKEVWRFTHSNGELLEARDIIADTSGYIITGFTSTPLKGTDAYLLKLDLTGKAKWHRYYGGDQDEKAFSVISTIDGGFAFIGYTYSYGRGDADAYLVKTTSTGQESWYRTFGGECVDLGYSLVQTSNGNFFIGSVSRSFAPKFNDLNWAYLDTNGVLLHSGHYPGTISESGSSSCIVNDSLFAFSHYTIGNRGSYAVLTKLGFRDPSVPTLRGVYSQYFTCLQSLEVSGFHGDGSIDSTFWDYDPDEEAMISKAPGAKVVSSIYTKKFNAHRLDSMTVAKWKVFFPTSGGPNWEKDNKFWVSLCDSTGKKLYTILFKPQKNVFLSKRWIMKLIKNYDGDSESDEDREQQVLSTTFTTIQTPLGYSKIWVNFMMSLQSNGNIIVFLDTKNDGNFIPVISASDKEYSLFSKMHFQYRTGKKASNNYSILIDDIDIREMPKETSFP